MPDGRWSLALDVCSAVCARVGERREKGCVAIVILSRSGMLRTDSSFARAHRCSLTWSESGRPVSATPEAATAERMSLASAASSLSCIAVTCTGGRAEGGRVCVCVCVGGGVI